jgi:phospholipid/cholesterol/gamma-HCH transport system substrate-binding protein
VTRRVVVNLVAFGLVFVLLAGWAATNVLHLDLFEEPYTVVAEFDHSPGLRPDVEVAYLGTRVGTISRVELRPGHVEVALRIDDGVELPAEVTAAVRRKSAVGEPYVDLAPGPDGANGRLEGGDRIPLERTSTPLDYAELFAALADLVEGIPRQDVQRLVHELAVGLEGRGESINELVTGLAEVTSTFAERGDELDRLASDLTTLTHTFATHRGSLVSGVDDLAALADSLAQSRGDVEALLAQQPSFTDRFADLLETSGDDLGCFVDAMGLAGERLTTEQGLTDLADIIGLGPEMLDVFLHVIDEEPSGPYFRTVNPVNLGLPGQDPTVMYETAPPEPVVPPIQPCPNGGPTRVDARPR